MNDRPNWGTIMLIFDITHTTLSGTMLVGGCRQYTGIMDFIERTNEFEKVGYIVLFCAFVTGVWLIATELYKRAKGARAKPTKAHQQKRKKAKAANRRPNARRV